MVFQVLHNVLAVWISGVVVGVGYVTPKPRSKFGIALNGIHEVHQPSMNL
jgi:hypothetical protein